MDKKYIPIFIGIIALILLGLYVILGFHIIKEVINCGVNTECQQQDFSDDNIIKFVIAFEGLLSASVVSKLSLTEPKRNPGIIRIGKKTQKVGWATNLTYIYLVAWLITGLSAFIVGVLIYPDINTTLNNFGTNWMALALSSVAIYLGVKPNS